MENMEDKNKSINNGNGSKKWSVRMFILKKKVKNLKNFAIFQAKWIKSFFYLIIWIALSFQASGSPNFEKFFFEDAICDMAKNIDDGESNVSEHSGRSSIVERYSPSAVEVILHLK